MEGETRWGATIAVGERQTLAGGPGEASEDSELKALNASAITLFFQLRNGYRLVKRPATAELIDWVAALRRVFQRDEVLEVITESAGTVNKETREDNVDWTRIPGITCLLKLREDLETTRALT